MSSKISRIAFLFLALFLAGCQRMDAGEYGVVFSAMPWFFGGGVESKLVQPGEMELVFPWETLYRMNTTSQTLTWGQGPNGEDTSVETRARDGNEVGLAMKVRYKIEPTMIHHIIQNVAPTKDRVSEIVRAVAQADIRTHMNVLQTRQFFDPGERQKAVDRVKEALRARLDPEGVIVEDVLFDGYQFERRIFDDHGNVARIDRSYQEQIDQTQASNEETQQELKKVGTVVEQKKQEFSEMQAKVNRAVEQADGFKRQAMLRGDAYLEAKKNEQEQVLAVGMAEVEGLKSQIAALNGPGGKAILRLAIVRELLASNAKFVVLNGGQSKTGIDVNRIDTNDLLREAGVLTGLKDDRPAPNSAIQSTIVKPEKK